MTIRRQKHALYDCSYHIVWAPKYRKWILEGEIREEVKKIFEEIIEGIGLEKYAMEVSKDHIHLFLSIPPRYSVSEVVRKFKCISAKEIFMKYPHVKRELWGGEFWEDGYFVRTTGDQVTSEVVKKYIEYQSQHSNKAEQLDFDF